MSDDTQNVKGRRLNGTPEDIGNKSYKRHLSPLTERAWYEDELDELDRVWNRLSS